MYRAGPSCSASSLWFMHAPAPCVSGLGMYFLLIWSHVAQTAPTSFHALRSPRCPKLGCVLGLAVFPRFLGVNCHLFTCVSPRFWVGAPSVRFSSFWRSARSGAEDLAAAWTFGTPSAAGVPERGRVRPLGKMDVTYSDGPSKRIPT